MFISDENEFVLLLFLHEIANKMQMMKTKQQRANQQPQAVKPQQKRWMKPITAYSPFSFPANFSLSLLSETPFR